MKLSDHFTLEEFTASATARAEGIANAPNAAQLASMKALCAAVLEPVRANFGPVRITSGFRSPKLCLAIGSKVTSQHAKGEAADFEVTGTDNYTLARWIAQALPFDQLILENHVRSQPNSGWVHCSYRAGGNRKQVLTILRGRTFAGLIA
jgi:zinc D-Ala-D-Ala carboxypeptidase